MRSLLFLLVVAVGLGCGSTETETKATPVAASTPTPTGPITASAYVELMKEVAKIHTDAKGDCTKIETESKRFQAEHQKELASATPKLFKEIDDNKDLNFWMRTSMDEIMKVKSACRPAASAPAEKKK
jgi:hypothetical protein